MPRSPQEQTEDHKLEDEEVVNEEFVPEEEEIEGLDEDEEDE